MMYQQQMAPGSNNNANSGYGWYNCSCCPYGYHIDLDFVRYCESIGQETERSGSFKRRKDRRRQRQSMEVLLGLTPPPLIGENTEQVYKTIQETDSPYRQDGFDDAVFDFEQTLQRSKKKTHNNLPDVTAVSVPPALSVSSTSGANAMVLPPSNDGPATRDFDTSSIDSCGLSPAALQNIREQMALSLERTKELEDQVKLIPKLKAQLVVLTEEKRKLELQLKDELTARLNTINANYINNISSRMRSHSFSVVDSADENSTNILSSRSPTRRDFGVMCGVLTRNVGVGHQYPHTRNVSTITMNGGGQDSLTYTDKWYNEKIKFLSIQDDELNYNKPALANQSSQTPPPVPKSTREVNVQTLPEKKAIPKPKLDGYTQTPDDKKTVYHVGSSAKPSISECTTQVYVQTRNVGIQFETPCQKCSVLKKSVGVGSENPVDSHISPVSLASLSTPRSKSFNLGEDKLNLSLRNRSIGCQYDKVGNTVGCQYEIKTHSKACQNDVQLSHKAIQNTYQTVHKVTDTKDLGPVKHHVACETKKEVKKSTAEFGCNTPPMPPTPEKSVCTKCTPTGKEKEEIPKKEGSPTPSRIPRPQIPTTPVENRKFRRQDTYTKIPSSAASIEKLQAFAGLSGLDLPVKNAESDPAGPLEKVKHKLHEISSSSSSSSQNGVSSLPTKVQVQEATLPVPESTLHLIAQKHRQKAEPSKEMQAAMKVVNDSLQKSSTKNLKNQLKNATSIIQQEWFRISSHQTANPLDVEDYLDTFDEVSSALLEYIVNMTDSSGNTAMHYAVSHGNFDVVSILLDSKVCDINKPNLAGYTCVMLVSLAEVRSQTHAHVVRRLFQLADVNTRALQHGQTALMLAVSHGRLDMVKMLLEAGADINIQDEDGSTALMCAAEHGHLQIVQHFLSQPDCDSSITDVDGSNALKIAMEAGHRHIGVLLYAHERNFHGGKPKRSKSSSASPKTPSSPLPFRSTHRALPDTKSNN